MSTDPADANTPRWLYLLSLPPWLVLVASVIVAALILLRRWSGAHGSAPEHVDGVDDASGRG